MFADSRLQLLSYTEAHPADRGDHLDLFHVFFNLLFNSPQDRDTHEVDGQDSTGTNGSLNAATQTNELSQLVALLSKVLPSPLDIDHGSPFSWIFRLETCAPIAIPKGGQLAASLYCYAYLIMQRPNHYLVPIQLFAH